MIESFHLAQAPQFPLDLVQCQPPLRFHVAATRSSAIVACTITIDSYKRAHKTTTEGKHHRFFATCAPGLEAVVAAELSSPAICAFDVKVGSSGVYFTGSLATAFNANLWLRCAIRVLAELSCSSLPLWRGRKQDPIYEFVRESVDWPALLVHDRAEDIEKVTSPSSAAAINSRKFWRFRSFAVQTRTKDCRYSNNSMVTSVRAKDAICDSVRDACNGYRPDPPKDGGAHADVPLFLSIYKDQISLYRDMSGISLHRRGYRDAMHRASLNEAVAAGILTLAGWNREVLALENFNRSQHLDNHMFLLDPMCGSGTFLIEAALISCNKAPGLSRSNWPFQTWHDFDSTTWNKCKENAAAAAKSYPPEGIRLFGNDIHEGALSLCVKDSKSAGVHDLLNLSCSDCKEYNPPIKPSIVVVNPPWGSRLGFYSDNGSVDVSSSWESLGYFLKERCQDTDAYVLSGYPTITRSLRMRADKKWPISVGGVKCKLLHYHVL